MGIRSFHARSIGSVGQKAAKLLAVKVGVLKKKVDHPALVESLSPESSLPGFKSFSKFEGQ